MTLCPTSLADGKGGRGEGGYRKDVVEKDFKYAAPSEVVGRAVEITKHAGFQYFNKLGMYVCVCVCMCALYAWIHAVCVCTEMAKWFYTHSPYR